MPNLDFAILSVAATEDGETFNLLGAGVEEVRVAQLPTVTLVYLTARWEWDELPVGTQATVGVMCRCLETAAVLFEKTYEVSVQGVGAATLPARLLTPLPLSLTSYGRHVVELSVLRHPLKRLPFVVRGQ